ncbi:MAG: hypothetical protein ACYC5G_03410 [Candidatus Doudnabacteria bacterium]
MMNHNNHDSKMMWWMMICCLAPIILVLISGTGIKDFGVGTWIIFGIVIVFVVRHLLVMIKTRKNKDSSLSKDELEDKKQGSHTDNNSCY